ncbi:hypothetical protein P7K49_028273 [Saguinus oedipus]|uniref:Uncharacterized protein n=1 Tax=Saguinus oedipus TaxID=9490 RepID=A0ABQ9UBX5_SAGOE|nr:hypothetical protein P7K49_028273 [Saguinus oedipus]
MSECGVLERVHAAFGRSAPPRRPSGRALCVEAAAGPGGRGVRRRRPPLCGTPGAAGEGRLERTRRPGPKRASSRWAPRVPGPGPGLGSGGWGVGGATRCPPPTPSSLLRLRARPRRKRRGGVPPVGLRFACLPCLSGFALRAVDPLSLCLATGLRGLSRGNRSGAGKKPGESPNLTLCALMLEYQLHPQLPPPRRTGFRIRSHSI